MLRLLSFVMGVSFASAQAAGNVTALCQALLTGTCSNYGTPFTGTSTAVNQSQCETWFSQAIPNAGFDNETSGNTIGCRQHYAALATDNTTDYWCAFAGFSGGGVCGNALNNTCDALITLCPAASQSPYNGNVTACQNDLAARAAVFGSKTGAASASEDSLECRLYHAVAGTTTGAVHCSHIPLASSQCNGPVSVSSKHYCGLIGQVCTGANVQYNQYAICQGAFATFAVGPGVNNTVNGASDQSSRQYHANAASAIGPVHCQHAGPTGGGVCGTTRQAWQQLANSVQCKAAPYGYVSNSVNLAFANWTTADLDAIVPQGANASSFRSDQPSTGNDDICRLYHLTVATTAVSHCSHGDLLGGGQCPLNAPQTPACLIVQTACGTSNYASQAACEAAFGPYFAQNKTGDPNSMNPTDDSIACRLYQATLALIARKNNATGTPASCANAKIAGGSCVGTSMKSSASTVALSGVVSLLMFLW